MSVGRVFEDRHRVAHTAAVGVGRTPPVQVGSGADQRQDGIGEVRHGGSIVPSGEVVACSVGMRRASGVGEVARVTS